MLYDYFVAHPRQLKEAEKEINRTKDSRSKIERSKISVKLYRINLPPMISFPASEIDAVSIWIIFTIFLFTGFLSGFLGVGGG